MCIPDTTVLSSERRDSLVKLLETALHEDPRALRTSGDFIADVNKVAHYVVDLVRSRVTSPIHHLPPELICSIFYWLSFKDVVRSSGTCRLWRVTVLDDPAIWSRVAVRYYSSGNLLREFLHRSKSAPVQLDLTVLLHHVDSDLSDIPQTIRDILPRLSGLVIRLGLAPEPAFAFSNFLRSINLPATRLRYLEIQLPQEVNRLPAILPLDIFAGSAPRLRDVYLSGIFIDTPANFSLLKDLRTIVCTSVSPAMSWRGLRDLLFCGIHLAHVVVCMSADAFHNTQVQVLPPRPSLRSLRIACIRTHRNLNNMIPKILDDETMTHTEIKTVHAYYPFHPSERPESIVILPSRTQSYDPDCFSYVQKQKDVPNRIADLLTLRDIAGVLNSIVSIPLAFNLVHEIVLSGNAVVFSTRPPCFPALRHLTVTLDHKLVPFRDYAGEWIGSAINTATNLETLRFAKEDIATKTLSNEIYIESFTLLGWLDIYRSGLPRLKRLVLCDVRAMLLGADIKDFAEELIYSNSWVPPALPHLDDLDRRMLEYM